MTRAVTWPAGRRLVRAHPHLFGSTEFDHRADTDGRFSPLWLDDGLVGVLYAGVDDRTAAAETIFHALPGGDRPRRVWLDRHRAWHWSPVAPVRDLALLAIDRTLEDAGPLVDGGAESYPHTRRRAAALLAAHPEADGLAWCSPQLHERPSGCEVSDDAAVCLLLVAPTPSRRGGVGRGELAADGPVVPFATAEGVERLDRLAADLEVTVVRS